MLRYSSILLRCVVWCREVVVWCSAVHCVAVQLFVAVVVGFFFLVSFFFCFFFWGGGVKVKPSLVWCNIAAA